MDLCQDFRIVGRSFWRSPGSTILIVLTLGFALGADSAIFSLIDRVALRPLPVEKPDARTRSLKLAPEPTLFRPLAQSEGYGRLTVLLRTTNPNAIKAAAVVELAKRQDPFVAVTQFGGLAALARETFLREQMLAGLSVLFAALSLVVASLGMFGVASSNVTRRTRELGVRLALGASRRNVRSMILREIGVLVVCGEATGLGLYLAANQVLRSMLFQVSANDPLTIGAAAAALAIVAVTAGLLPAYRAANVDPAVTLRYDN